MTVLREIVAEFNRKGLMAVYVVPGEGQIDLTTLRDRRDEGDTVLSLVVWVGRVAEIRTIARGPRFRDGPTINLPQHRRIAAHGPIAADGEGAAGDILLREPVNEYLLRLNRHPGRRVDLSIAAGAEPGDLVVDWLVNETKPWFVFAQVSNTGPRNLPEWRARTGIAHYQLTGADDIISADYLSDFSGTMAASVSYSRPLKLPDYWGVRLRGSWSDFTAEDLGGAPGFNFSGTTYTAMAEVFHRPFVWRRIAFEVSAGLEYRDISVFNEVVDDEGEQVQELADASAGLIMPYAGLSFIRRDRFFSFSGFLQVQTNVSSVDEETIDQLGRLNVEDRFTILSGSLQGSVFLEPLFLRGRWGDGSSWQSARLAHELRLTAAGQYGFDNRSLAQTQFLLGGFDRVRGFPESARAGDGGFRTSLEYAYHLPRALKPVAVKQREMEENGDLGAGRFTEPFLGRYNLRPPDLFALPDWNFLLKGFFDYGRVTVTEPVGNEDNETLLSAGVGIELQFASHFNIRVDWATVLRDLKARGLTSPDVEAGDSRVHVRAQISW